MKRFFYLILLSLFAFGNTQAQTTEENEIQDSFQQMEEELARIFKDFNQLMISPDILSQDTMITHFFTFPMDELGGQFQQVQPDSMMMGDMFNWMQGQMQQFSQEDWSGFEELFRNFGDQLQLMPLPKLDELEQAPGQKNKKKKRKTTTL